MDRPVFGVSREAFATGESEGMTPRQRADLRLACAGFNLLDKTGRALNVGAAELGERIDLVELIESATALELAASSVALEDNSERNAQAVRLRASLSRVRAALSTLPALP